MASDSLPTDAALHGAALREAKLTLRRAVLARRDALATDDRAAAGAAIAAGLAALASFASARTVLLTLPFRSEWDTLPLVRQALAAGKSVVVPRVNATTRMLELHAIEDPVRDAGPGHQGIPEPLAHCPMVAPGAVDWVLVPGVAFDEGGWRIGYGGGYYDRLLPSLAAVVPRIAGAFNLQLVARVPSAEHDIAVDAIVTETRTIVPAS